MKADGLGWLMFGIIVILTLGAIGIYGTLTSSCEERGGFVVRDVMGYYHCVHGSRP